MIKQNLNNKKYDNRLYVHIQINNKQRARKTQSNNLQKQKKLRLTNG